MTHPYVISYKFYEDVDMLQEIHSGVFEDTLPEGWELYDVVTPMINGKNDCRVVFHVDMEPSELDKKKVGALVQKLIDKDYS